MESAAFLLPLLLRMAYAIATMDYSAYIIPAYVLTAVLVGGLIIHTWVSARRTARALTKQGRHEA